MSTVPSGILYVNNDLSESALAFLTKQLFINKVMDGYSFDNLVLLVPDIKDNLKQFNQRILVIRSFDDFVNRNNIPNWNLADVVIFVKQGMAAIEECKFGTHGATFRVLDLTWNKLSKWDLPFDGKRNCPNNCGCCK